MDRRHNGEPIVVVNGSVCDVAPSRGVLTRNAVKGIGWRSELNLGEHSELTKVLQLHGDGVEMFCSNCSLNRGLCLFPFNCIALFFVTDRTFEGSV